MIIKRFFKFLWSPSTALGLALILLPFYSYLPSERFISYLILLGLVTSFILRHIITGKRIDFGPKAVFIPLLIILSITIIQVIIGTTTISATFFMLTMVLVYLMCREYNEKVFSLFVPVLIVVSLSCIIIHGIIDPGIRGGGILHPTNYNLAIGFMALGMVLIRNKWQWLIVCFVLLGIFMTGGEEGLVFIAGFIIMVLVRRDFGKKLLLPIMALGVLILVFTATGTTQSLYFQVTEKIQIVLGSSERLAEGSTLDSEIHNVFQSRWDKNKDAIKNTSILGRGFDPTDASIYSIHNIPLKIWDEMGPVASLSWLWLVGYGFVKFKNKRYIFGTIFLLSIFDNFVWTQLTPYMFVALGVSMPKSDYIFKDVDNV